MKVIIAGSRRGFRYSDIERFLATVTFNITTVVCGGAAGVDELGKVWAKRREIPVKMYEADWDTYGRSAGFVRNQEMAEDADALIAIWDGTSKGTHHMIETARKKGLLVKVFKVDLTERLQEEAEAARQLVS